MARRNRLIPLVATLSVLCVLPSVASASCSGESARPTAGNIAVVSAATHCLINERRAQAGLAPVGRDEDLEDAAVEYSQRMVDEHFFAHTAPDGSDLFDRLELTYLADLLDWLIGENLGYGTGAYSTPRSMVQSWMDSPGHRANILDGGYRAVGVGIATGNPTGPGGATYTTDFATTTKKATKKRRKAKSAKAKCKKVNGEKAKKRCLRKAKRAAKKKKLRY